MKLIYCFALTITVVGCSPLRNVQTEKHTSLDIADTANRRYMNFSELNNVGMKFEPKNQGV